MIANLQTLQQAQAYLGGQETPVPGSGVFAIVPRDLFGKIATSPSAAAKAAASKTQSAPTKASTGILQSITSTLNASTSATNIGGDITKLLARGGVAFVGVLVIGFGLFVMVGALKSPARKALPFIGPEGVAASAALGALG